MNLEVEEVDVFRKYFYERDGEGNAFCIYKIDKKTEKIRNYYCDLLS